MRIAVQAEAFDPGAELTAFSAGHRDMGAAVTFTGIVRDLPGGGLEAMEIEHYPGMTAKAIRGMAEEAVGRWPSLQSVLPGDFRLNTVVVYAH